MKMMTSSFLTGLRKIELLQIECPKPKAGEMLVKVRACSVCGSDIRIYNYGNERVKYPAVMGHEMAGEVVEVGEGIEGFGVGDRVCVGADIPSMRDDWSKNGMANLSDINYAIGYQFPGGFAEYCLLNELTVKFGPIARIPEHLGYEEACLTEPLACCINGLERAFMEPGKSVLVIGTGPIGVLLARAAVALGAGLIVMADIDPKRVQKAKELGLKFAYDANDEDLKKITSELTEGQGFNIVFTTCSNPEAQEAAINLVSKRGVVNLFGGLPKDSRNISIPSNIVHYKEAYITGSHGSAPKHFKLALRLIASERIEVKSLVTHQFPLKEIEKAFETMEKREGLKVIVTPWPTKE